VTWRGNTDGGMNGFGSDPHKVPPYFDIAPDATGGLLLSDQVFSRGAGYAREERAPFVYRKSSSAQDGNESSLGSFLVSLDRCAQKPAPLFPFFGAPCACLGKPFGSLGGD
jgi:hypothetical protein